MKILHIIGNGFDLNLGIRTKYTDFYEYYKSLDGKSESVKFLKKAIDRDITNWSDLELALGHYTENIKDVNDFDEVYEDLLDNLGEYLQYQEDKFDFSKTNTGRIYNYLSYPENSLSNADRNKIATYKNAWQNEHWKIKIMTFNYTRTIEKLLDLNNLNFNIGYHHNNRDIILTDLQHIHGYCDDRMVMGVNDIDQMANKKFHQSQEIIEAIIKTHCNKAYKHNVDDTCRQQIETSNLICIFGSSLGNTDNYWWELVGNQLKRGCHVIIYTKGEEISQRKGYKLARTEREIKKLFFSKTSLNDNEIQEVSEKVTVTVNSKMFSGIINE